jgi:hypothetical protein
MRPADVKQVADALRSTDDDAEEQTQQQPPLQLEFQVSEQVEWYLGDEGHEKLQSSQELSEWLAYHRLQHCAAQLEKHGIDMDVLRIAADDEDLRVGAFTDLGERDEHLMLQAIENPDQSWYRGTVTALRGSPTIEVSILLDDGRAVTEEDFKRIRKFNQNIEDGVNEADGDGGGGGGGGGSSGGGCEEAAKPQTVEAAILKYGWEIQRGGKHMKLSRMLVLGDGSEVYQRGPTLSCTASDVRARKNQLADLMRKERDTYEQKQMLEDAPGRRGEGSMAARWQPDVRY